MLFPNDERVLKACIKAQGNEHSYLFLDKEKQCCFFCPYVSAEYVSSLTYDDARSRFHIPSGSVSASVDYLVQNGYLSRITSGGVYQVTHLGWNHKMFKAAELVKLIATHLLFPAVVAFITTVLTLVFLK